MAQRLLLEGTDIDELLARVRTEHGPQARIVHAEQKLVGGFGGFFARRRYEVAVAIDDEPTDRPIGAPASLAELLAVADSQDGAPAGGLAAAPTGPGPGAAFRAPGRALSTESASFDHLVRDLVARAAPETRPVGTGFAASVAPAVAPSDVARIIDLDRTVPASGAPAPRPEPAPRPAPARPVPAPGCRPVPQMLLDLGLPVTGADPRPPQDHRTGLLDFLAGVAVGTPTQARGVQVVVGPADAGRRLVDAWLRLCGADSSAVLDLSDPDEPAVQDGPRELVERLERLEFHRGGVLVVVPAGDTRSQARTAGRRIAHLHTDAVIAVVDARWDGAVVGAWLAALADGGGPATHLAGHGVGESPTPLRLLEHDLPVTWLDARPATLGTWAAPCLDRWDEAVRER